MGPKILSQKVAAWLGFRDLNSVVLRSHPEQHPWRMARGPELRFVYFKKDPIVPHTTCELWVSKARSQANCCNMMSVWIPVAPIGFSSPKSGFVGAKTIQRQGF